MQSSTEAQSVHHPRWLGLETQGRLSTPLHLGGLWADPGCLQWWSSPWRHYMVSDFCPCALGQLCSWMR